MKCENCPTPRTCEAATSTVPACKATHAIVAMDAPGNLFEVAREMERRLAKLEESRD